MSDILISLCMICKDEGELIKNTLESIKDIVDEIIVFDMGSKDKSKEVINRYGGVVYEEDFLDDFSLIRNKALEKAKGEWVLILNCDEVIDNENKEKIFRYIRNNNCKGIYLRVNSFINGKIRGSDNYLRLFKNDNNIRFNGKIQESVVDSIIKNYGDDLISYSDIEIKSYGSDDNFVDLSKKSEINMKILNSYCDSEKDCKYFYNLGNEYGKNFDFNNALRNYNKALALINKDIEDDLYLRLSLNIIKSLYQLNMYEEERKVIDNLIIKYNDFKDLYFMDCLLRIQLREFSKAKESLYKYIEKENNIKYPSSEFHEIINIEELKNKLNNIDLILE